MFSIFFKANAALEQHLVCKLRLAVWKTLVNNPESHQAMKVHQRYTPDSLYKRNCLVQPQQLRKHQRPQGRQ